jgi:PleD family two-component response regulator
VLVVSWSGVVPAGARVTVLELLAHESASVLGRGDALTELAEDASTDRLTGLPNRRTWEAHPA